MNEQTADGDIRGRVRAIRLADQMDAYLRLTNDRPLPADAAVRRAADRLRELAEGRA